MFEMFSYPFMQRAMAAGLMTGLLGSYYGVFIVQRRMSFLGSGLAHAAFGGVALGLLLNTEPLWIAIPFTILVSVLINLLREKTRLQADTTIGILFSVSVALGIVFLSLKDNYTVDAFTYLFGSILAVTTEDILTTAILVLISGVLSVIYWKRWAYASFDEELALSDGLSVRTDNYLLNILTAVAIVVSIKLVGIILIASFLVIPAASARLITATFFRMTLFSLLFGIISAVAGLWISYLANLPSGASIILFQSLIFFLCIFSGRLLKYR